MKRFAEEILAKIDAEIQLRDCGVDSAMDNAFFEDFVRGTNKPLFLSVSDRFVAVRIAKRQ